SLARLRGFARELSMTRRREGQRGFGQVVLFGLLGPPETLLDPALRRIDGLLDDEALVDAVWRALRSRYPQSARGGGAGAPAAGGYDGGRGADSLSDGQRAVRGRHPGPAPGRAAARGGRDSAARRSARRASEREPADARDRPGITAPGRGGAHGAATALPGA